MCSERQPLSLPPPLPWCCIFTSAGPSGSSPLLPPPIPRLNFEAPPHLPFGRGWAQAPQSPGSTSPASFERVVASEFGRALTPAPSGDVVPESIGGLAPLRAALDRRLPMPMILLSWFSRCEWRVLSGGWVEKAPSKRWEKVSYSSPIWCLRLLPN